MDLDEAQFVGLEKRRFYVKSGDKAAVKLIPPSHLADRRNCVSASAWRAELERQKARYYRPGHRRHARTPGHARRSRRASRRPAETQTRFHMVIRQLTETEFRILDALRGYRYLTVDQMLRLGVSKNRSRLYTVLSGLTEGKRPFVGVMKHGVLPGQGRLPHSHYLTRKGAQLLADALQIDPAEVPYPKSAAPIRTHFFHRLHCIDAEISVRLWAAAQGVTVDYYHAYFDVTGANRGKASGPRRALTKIDLADGRGIIPDTVFQMTWPTGEVRLFVLEVYNQNRTKRMHDKLADYRYALGEHAINRQFDYPHAPRILALFETERSLELTRQRMAESGAFGPDFAPFFFLKTHAGLAEEFRTGWSRVGQGQAAGLFVGRSRHS